MEITVSWTALAVAIPILFSVGFTIGALWASRDKNTSYLD